MPIRRMRPTSHGTRQITYLVNDDLTKGKAPEGRLLEPLPRSGGRNNHGHVTMRHRGGGAKARYRVIDWKRNKDGVPAKVTSIEHDPSRNARIALLTYADGDKRYVLAPLGLEVGHVVMNGPKAEAKNGSCLPLRNIPVGLTVHAVELVPGRGAQMARAAGAGAVFTAKEGDHALLTLPSTEMRRVHLDCRATVGQVGNLDANLVVIGTAGRHRHMGYRPYSRGSAQNPVSHPMGGGEGRRAGGRHPVSKWGVLSKGGNTRKPRKASNRFIVRGRRRGPQVGR
ncbi:MAG: 50S ribosomal protein L2 [Planctomycetes bacterium]|nr:50S ribosomal protein L2 [Planctomycetota bacterium]